MSADPNALLAFKQSNLKERVSARSSARVHRLGPIRRASGANSASLFPPTFIRSILRSSDAPTRRPLNPQLEVYRQEIANGERQIADLRRKQASYEERLNAVASEWNTLQDDIVAMVERTGGARASTTRASSSASNADIKDPFLRRLFDLAGADAIAGRKRAREDDDGGADGASATDSEDEDGAAAKEGGPDDDAVKAVDAIKAKAAATKAALVAVLDTVDE